VNGTTEVSVNPTFSWEAAVDPEGERITYTILVIPAQGGRSLVNTVQGTTYTMLNQLLPGTTYYWRVTAEDPKRNIRRSPFYSFTTVSGGGGSGGGQSGGGSSGPSIQPVPNFTLSGVRKGVILHNPAIPNYLLYVYIDSALYVYSRRSTDGGSTWSAPLQIGGLSNARDIVAALSGNGNAIALIINDATDDTCAGSGVMITTLPYGQPSWTAPEERMGTTTIGLRRLPSVVRINGNEYLFGWGFDAGGFGTQNETKAVTLYWDGFSIVSQNDVGINNQTDDPVFCQQVGFDLFSNAPYYLYFNDLEGEIEGGDLYLVSGSYPPIDWSTAIDLRVVNTGSYQRPSQGFLFRETGGDYILIYALETGPKVSPTGNALYMRRSSNPFMLENAADLMLDPSLKVPQDNWSRYRTLYAAQDPSGNIYVVWQDASNTIKCVMIDSITYPVGTIYTVATGKHLDSISVGEKTLFLSLISDLNSSNTVTIVRVTF